MKITIAFAGGLLFGLFLAALAFANGFQNPFVVTATPQAVAIAMVTSTPTATSTSTPSNTPTETPTSTPTVAVWDQCDVDVVLVRTDAGADAQPGTPVAYTANGVTHWEKWEAFVTKPQGISYSHWGDPVTTVHFIPSWKYLPQKGMEYEFLNATGLVAYGSSWGGIRIDPWRCRVSKLESVSWAETSSRQKVGQAHVKRGMVVPFEATPEPEGGYEFLSTFFVGKQLSQEELNWVYQKGDSVHWAGTGFVGGGSSTTNFSFASDGKVIWGEQDLGFVVPIETEIVVVTNFPAWPSQAAEVQRFVLIYCGEAAERVCSLELPAPAK